MAHVGMRTHVWEFVREVSVSAGWLCHSYTLTTPPHFVCVGGHDGKGCGAKMSVEDAARALTARQNAALERDDALAEAVLLRADLMSVKERLKEACGEAEGWQNIAGHARRQADEAIRDLAEARAIAGELARCLRWKGADNPDCHCKACGAYRAIRPGVRKWLEGK